MLQTFFTRKALIGKLDTQIALQGNFNVISRALQRHLSTRKLEGHLGTRVLRHSGTWTLEALYLADSNLTECYSCKGIFLYIFPYPERYCTSKI